MTLLTCGCVASGHRLVDGEQVPSCFVHGCTEPAPEKPSLEGRQAKCAYGCSPRPSDYDLPFFEYRGPGSRAARETCGVCGFYECAHEYDEKRVEPRGRIERGLCSGFEPKTFDFDLYYCGCHGWD